MPSEQDARRDWHRLFGLLLADVFTGSPFVVEVERDLSVQQQLLDVLIIRRTRGRFAGRLPDGLDGLRPHNLVTFKSHRETLDAWAIKELVGHSVAYRKLVSPSPSDLLAEDQFGLYAVAARFPQLLSEQVPWENVQPGVYDCRWGTDTVRVVVAGELSREPRNAPLHLFSARPELIAFGGRVYRPQSRNPSSLLAELFAGFQAEGFAMPYTMEDFERDFVRKRVQRLTPEERLAGLTPEQILAALPPEQIRQYLEQLPAAPAAPPRKSRKKK